MESLREYSKVIDTFVNYIPARYYLHQDDLQQIIIKGNENMKTTDVLYRLAKKSKNVKKQNLKQNHTLESDVNMASVENKKKKNKKDKKNKKKNQEEDGSEKLTKKQKMANKIQELKEKKIQKAETRKTNKTETESSDVSFGNINTEKAKLDHTFNDPVKGNKMKNLEKTIRDQERANKKLDKLPVNEKTKIVNESRMEKALQKASGEKIKDDVSRLKKAKKSLEKKKDKNAQKWVNREQKKKEDGVKQQEKRSENIKNFRGKNASKKTKERKGFEGQKTSILNGDSDL